MRNDLIVKSKTLTGVSDLTLLAPLKAGLVDSVDSASYKTRTRRLLALLSGARSSSHEYAFVRPLSDSIERVAHIHSVRVAIVEPEDKVLLSVSFDGTWEAYIRVLWHKVGSLLDVIFCNTEGYVLSTGSFEAWCAWVRSVQVDTGFFFSTHALTVPDVEYLRGQEALHRGADDAALARLESVRARSVSAEQKAWQQGQTDFAGAAETLRQGLQLLALLYRLADLYRPGTPDGDVLLRAARSLLVEFLPLFEDPDLPGEVRALMLARFPRQLEWLLALARPDICAPRALPALPQPNAPDRPDQVQVGVLQSYPDDISHGALLLIAVDAPQAMAALLDRLAVLGLSSGGDAPQDGLYRSVSFTAEGLRRCGLDETELGWLPPEFLQGMAARASMLGDLRHNHPRRWQLPRRNWPANLPVADRSVVEWDQVHVVVQIRGIAGGADLAAANLAAAKLAGGDDVPDPAHPLNAATRAVVDRLPGVTLLAVEGMHRGGVSQADGQPAEHFGFADGLSQPRLDSAGPPYPNQIAIGELLLGYANEADAAPDAADPQIADKLSFLRNGSFLVLRKIEQNLPRLRELTLAAAEKTGLDPGLIVDKLMGRGRDGAPLGRPAAVGNNFTHDDDPTGAMCPLHAHVRRANPRDVSPGRAEPPGRRRPRLMRRGMSFGPSSTVLPGDAVDKDGPVDETPRGLMFMAYNASIAEQFEVVQRWISGGNSTGGYSGHSDPFLGVPEAGQQRSFSFEHAGQRHNIALDGAPAPFEPPRPITRLLWGAYLFVPSLTSIAWLEARALAARGRRLPRPLWSVERGDREIARLQALALAQGADAARLGWKQTLEDAQAQQEFLSASVWAAIRHHHGGALRTPYGVLVAGADLVDEVLGDDTRFSVRGYRQRMVASGMDIYLGLDGHDPRYAALADRVNAEIGRIGFADTFQRARDTARAKLDLMVSLEKMSALSVGAPAWELNLDAQEIIEHTLAELCDAWCGMLVAAPLPGRPGAAPTLDRFARGGWRWSWQAGQASICPAHFNAPSRYFFQPDPGAASQDMGRTGALAAVTGMTAVVARHRAPGAPAAPAFMAGVLAALAAESDAVVGRTLAGVLMGFLPPADGNLRLVLNEWLRDGTFWRLRSLSRPAMPAAAVDDLLRPELLRALQVRCSPDMLWRTVVRANDQIGGQALQADEVVVVSLISQAQEKLEQDQDAPYAVFGGNRRPGRHPTHACPGYQAAMGAMLGVLAALLSTPQTMRPSPAALSFTLTGNVP